MKLPDVRKLILQGAVVGTARRAVSAAQQRRQRMNGTDAISACSSPAAARAGTLRRDVPTLVKWTIAMLSALTVLLMNGCSSTPPSEKTEVVPPVTPVPDSLRQSRNLPPFYQQHVSLHGFPILGSTNVSAYALREAAWIVSHMLSKRPDILKVMATNGARLVVMAHNEYTTDVPEHSHMRPGIFWDRRARGLGGRVSSCGEENLLSFPNDNYATENILIHEFGHAIANIGLRALDPSFQQRLRQSYQQATNAALWKGTYAGSNPAEYWAEGVQCWFDNNRENDAQHNYVNLRAELKQYDPGLAALCAEVFGEVDWSYRKPSDRPPSQRAHLAGFDFSKTPRFTWRVAPITNQPRVQLLTEFGEIEVELYYTNAPITVANFLRYVLEGYYRNGEFFRTVTPENQPTNEFKIQVLQARADGARADELYPPIPLERTRDTGLKHTDGTLSMARYGPDTAQDSFSICIGDQPELDFGGRRNSDGQGFAAFGTVIKGMEVIRKIHALRAEGQQLTPPVRIQGAFRLE
jgi:cyclophilin family peptidyl-prolyl cis-trans isomerase